MKFSTLEDTDLWVLVARGNQEAFSYVYNHTSRDLYKYGHKFTQDSELIEDVLQDIFVHLWELRQSLKIQKSIKFYLFTAFRRELINRLNRSQKSETLEDYHSNLSWQSSFEEVLLENQITLESSNKLSKAVDSLSVRQKEAIYLRYIQDLSYEEISLMMNIQIPSLYNLIYKGIRSMKEFLSSSDFSSKAIALLFYFHF